MDAITTYIVLLNSGDTKTKSISLNCSKYTNFELEVLFGCLISRVNIVERIYFRSLRISDSINRSLGAYLAISTKISSFSLIHTEIHAATYATLATALFVNTTLINLELYDNIVMDNVCIDVMFIDSLRINPTRQSESRWRLYTDRTNEYKRLNSLAKKCTPPSMLEFVLYVHLNTEKIKTATH